MKEVGLHHGDAEVVTQRPPRLDGLYKRASKAIRVEQGLDLYVCVSVSSVCFLLCLGFLLTYCLVLHGKASVSMLVLHEASSIVLFYILMPQK